MIDLNYLAGFIDGEGWIGVYKSTANGKQQKSDRYTLGVGIGQTLKGLNLFIELREQFGGNVSFYQPKLKNAQRQCKYVVLGSNALELLKKIEPFLILKKQQANLAISFQEKKNSENTKNNNYRGKILPEEVIREREKTYLLLKELNKKGI